MTVESATYISQLNNTFPLGGDPKSEGDNHLRLLKQVLQNQFPNLGAAAVAATADQLSALTRPMENRRLNLNGNFQVNQKAIAHGLSTFGNGYYADGWLGGSQGSTLTQSWPFFTLGQTAVPGEPTHFLRAAVTSVAGASNYTFLQTAMDDVRLGAGQTVTVSGWAKADTNRNIALELVQFFGSGGSAQVNTPDASVLSLTSSWAYFKRTFTLPSIAGKVIGNDSYLALNTWLEAGSSLNSRTNNLGQQSGTFDFSQIQVELGSVATPYVHKQLQEDRHECYHRRVEYPPTAFVGTGMVPATNLAYIVFNLPRGMRKTPTFVAGPGAGNVQIYTSAAVTTIASLGSTYGDGATFAMGLVPNTTLTAGQGALFYTNTQGLTLTADF